MKKKRILSIIIALSMLFMLVPFAAIAQTDELQTEYDSKTNVLTVELPYSPEENAWLIAASYKEDGNIEDVKVIEVTSDDGTTIEVEELAPAFRYRAFLLNKNEAAPIYSSGAGTTKYDEKVAAKGVIYIPEIDGAVAHSTAMAVDAHVEAEAAKEKAISLFDDTSDTYTTEDNKTEKINKIAVLAKSGSESDKRVALAKIEDAMSAMNQSLGAAAVLDAAAEKELKDTQASIMSTLELMSASSDKKAEAERWAMELEAKWDSLPRKERLKAFAEELGVDARTAYQALSDAHDIVSGKYNDDAKFYDICTRVAIGVKTASKVGVYVCATIATGGAASAAGGLTVAEAAGIVVGGVDCAVEMERSAFKIVLGDDHKVVQAVENSTAMQRYDAVMFIAGVATFDPKTATAAEKMLFVEDLVEKNISAYENVKVLTDEATGLVIDRIEGESKKIAAEYTRIESENPADLAPAAENVLGAENTGIKGVDPSLNDGTVKQQKEDFTKSMQSDKVALAKTYKDVKDGDKTLDERINEYKTSCDKKVTYKSPKNSGGEGGGGGGGGGGGSSGGGGSEGGGGGSSGGGSGGSEGGGGGEPNLPTPSMDYDTVEPEFYDTSAVDRYYKDGQNVGEVWYAIDENGRYWITTERWKCDNGDWVVTDYYSPGDYWDYSWSEGTKRITAQSYGIVCRRYGIHILWNGSSYVYYDTAEYFPNGQLREITHRQEGTPISRYSYSPEGILDGYEYDWDPYGLFNYEYEYYVYPCKDAPFDPTGHLSRKREIHAVTEWYVTNYNDHWCYLVVKGDNNGMDWNNTYYE